MYHGSPGGRAVSRNPSSVNAKVSACSPASVEQKNPVHLDKTASTIRLSEGHSVVYNRIGLREGCQPLEGMGTPPIGTMTVNTDITDWQVQEGESEAQRERALRASWPSRGTTSGSRCNVFVRCRPGVSCRSLSWYDEGSDDKSVTSILVARDRCSVCSPSLVGLPTASSPFCWDK